MATNNISQFSGSDGAIVLRNPRIPPFLTKTYEMGFKKIGLQKWEYEHYWFQPGKKQLLSNIKRRNQNQKVQEHCYQENYCNGVETELRSQRDFNVTLMSEIEKMKEKQDDLANGIASLREYLEKSDAKFRKLLFFLARGIKQVTKKRKVEDTT
ncbi:heat stress transcription factor A-9-like [Nicotiana tomentosiformis]|uniref:heat stress transcription factor A-9-like n=1 Tax=Nicotiana tomentosiformis TaxID=4098 RepID=UPI00388C41E7